MPLESPNFTGVPECESHQLPEQCCHFMAAHVGRKLTHSLLLVSSAQCIAHLVEQLTGRIRFHLLGSFERSIKIPVCDLAPAKHQQRLIWVSERGARLKGTLQVTVVRLNRSDDLGSSGSKIRSGESLYHVLGACNVSILSTNLRQLYDGPLLIVSPLEQMRRRPRVVVVALRRLLFKNLNIRPVAGFSSELPFRDRLPK